VKVSLGSDHSCQSLVQTRAFDAGPFPLVGLADTRICVSWVGGCHANLKLLVKRHRKNWSQHFHKLLGRRQEGLAYTSGETTVRPACVSYLQWQCCTASVQPERRQEGGDAEQPDIKRAFGALQGTVCQRRAQMRPVKRKVNRAIKRCIRNWNGGSFSFIHRRLPLSVTPRVGEAEFLCT
jgi:hypothetical protein